MSALLRTVFAQEDEDGARKQWRTVADQLHERFPKVADLMGRAEHEVLAHMWILQRRYMQLEGLQSLSDNQNEALMAGLLSTAAFEEGAPGND